MTLLAGILLALRHREQTGRGTKVSTSLMANGVWANSIYVQAALCGAPPFRPVAHATTPNALVSPYETADGRHFYLAMIQEEGEWPRFLEAIERRDLADDPRFATLPERRRNAAALVAILDDVFRAAPLAAWRERLDRHKVTFGVIARSDEAPADPQMRANGLFREIEGAAAAASSTARIWIAGVEKAPVRRPPGDRRARARGPARARLLGEPDRGLSSAPGSCARRESPAVPASRAAARPRAPPRPRAAPRAGSGPRALPEPRGEIHRVERRAHLHVVVEVDVDVAPARPPAAIRAAHASSAARS